MKKLSISMFLGFLVLIWSSVSRAQEFPPENQNFGQHRFDPMERLNLSDEQKSEFESLHFKHQKDMIELNSELKKSELDLQQIKSKTDFTRDEVLSVVKKISDLRGDIELVKEKHKMDLYEKLTPDQKKIWNEGQKKFHRFNEMKKIHSKKEFSND